MFSRFDTIPVCNRQTDRQIFCDGQTALCIASRDKNSFLDRVD